MGEDQSYERSYEPRLSARKSDVVIELREPRKRTWSDAERLQILREASAPGAVAKHVMARHGISSSLFYTWRKQALAAARGGFVAVRIDDGPPALSSATGAAPASPGSEESIEVFFPGEISVRVTGAPDARVLETVLKALRA